MELERLVLAWRRNIAIVYILLGGAVAAMLALGWYAYGPLTVAKAWGLTHGHAVTFDRVALKLPSGWREHDSVSRSDLHLEKPHAWRARLDTVDVDELAGQDADFQRMLNTLRSLESMAVSQGEVAAEYPVSESNRARFECMEHGAADRSTLHVTCLERDGRRVVRMTGAEDSRADFAAILTGLAAIR